METAAPLRRLVASLGLSIVFIVASVLVSAVVVVRGRLLDTDTYTSALVNADAYERVYTEVFADPDLAELQEELLGQLGLGTTLSTQARALGTNVLRWTVPPHSLRAGAETVIAGVLTYVRGDSARVDADVAIDSILDRIASTAVTEVRTLLAAAADRSMASIEEYRVAVAELADQLAAGTVPSSIPVIGGTTFDPLELIDAILDALGKRVDDEMRRQVTAAVLAGDERDALITAAAEVVADHATDIAAQLRVGTDAGELDVVEALADRARQPVTEIVSALDTVRTAASWLGPLTGMAASIVGAAALAGLLWLHRADWRRGGTIIAAALVASGLANAGLWAVVRSIAAPPLERASATGADSWNLPRGLSSLLADVQGSIAVEVSDAVTHMSVILIATGFVLAGAMVLGTYSFRVDARPALAAAAVTAVIIGVIGVIGAIVTSPIGAATARVCNGHAELCDRPYDEVVFAATHNSMSSPDTVQVWPEHDGDLQAQLDAGVRVLLIDSHYWMPVDALGDLTAAVHASESQVPKPIVDLVYGALGRLRDGREGTFLCHNHCAFGAIAFVEAMVTVREFVETNPYEVVTLIIQDAISVDDTAGVMEAAGLDEHLYIHGNDESWPTLGELIDRGGRVIVFAEEAGPPPAWYANAFDAMQETPFLFLEVDELSCAPNRGVDEAPLFLMNHWIQRIAPDRVDSVDINRHDVLVERARQCERERGQLPNYIAVNFYNIGDLMVAVDTLNGLTEDP